MMTLDELRSKELALAGEVEQLRHELRRVKDGLERAGGRDRLLEAKASQLIENIKICEEQLLENFQRQGEQ
ncbi:MAG: hypothetical protein GY806_16135 [Gammaproteobacteria bacterium]|nr:hypothetical protein [Gammaproteobacteria bacterium]